MSYNNQYGGYNKVYQNNRGFNNNRRNYRNDNNSYRQNYKRSGAKYTKADFEKKYDHPIIVNAWNFSRSRGLVTATVMPYKDSKVYENGKGEEKYTMVATVFYHKTGQELLIPCSMNLETRVIVLEKIGMVISPNGSGRTKSGHRVTGYFGTFNKN